VDLALRAGWTPIPLGLRDARVHAQRLPANPPPQPSPTSGEGDLPGGPGLIICRVDGLDHRYQGVPAVQGVSLTLRRGQVIALMGARAGLLLLDAPTRGLDPEVKRALSSCPQTRAGAGAGILVATHDVEWAARTADRILLIADGEIYADGPPAAVLSDSLVF